MRRIPKIIASATVCVAMLSSAITVCAAEAGEAVSYNVWGNKTVCEALGIDTGEYYKWLVNHDNDSANDYSTFVSSEKYDSSSGTNYYLGTKYTSGDHRTPKGDTKGYFDTDLYSPYSGYYCVGYGRQDELNGSSYKAQMNCTGFVWHVLYKSLSNTRIQKGSSLSYSYANTHIPSYSYAAYDTGQDTWVNWASNNNIKTYWFDGSNAIKNALNSGVLEKGDIIFLLGTADSHTGIFYGNNSGDNKFWHSKYQNVNTITGIESRGTCRGLYVYKTGCSKGIDLNIKLESTHNLKGTAYDITTAEYTVYTDSKCQNAIGKIKPQADGFGAFGLNSSAQYNSSSAVARGVPVAEKEYWCRETKAPNGYVPDSTIYKFERSTLSWGGTARYYAGVSVTENEHKLSKISKTPKIALRIQTVSAQPDLTDESDNYSLEGAVYEIYNSNNEFCGYMKTGKDGWVCATSTDKRDSIDEIEWNVSDYDSALYLPYGSYYAIQIESSEGFKKNENIISLDNVYKYTWSGYSVYYACNTVEAELKNVPYIGVSVYSELGMPIKNAELNLYADQNCTNLLDIAVTDEQGTAIFKNGVGTGTYYIRQNKLPSEYFINDSVTSVTVEESDFGTYNDISLSAKNKGDVTNDGIIDINDVTLIQLSIANNVNGDGSPLIDFSDKYNFENCDIDGDGKISINDITKLQIIILENR